MSYQVSGASCQGEMGAEAEGRKGLMGQDEEGACEGSKQRIHLSPVFTTEGQGKRGGDL